MKKREKLKATQPEGAAQRKADFKERFFYTDEEGLLAANPSPELLHCMMRWIEDVLTAAIRTSAEGKKVSEG